MGCSPDGCPDGFPGDLYRLLMRFPAFRYLKPPVEAVSELYERYPAGCEFGAFAYVSNRNAFYTWDFDTKIWKPIGSDGGSDIFRDDLVVSLRGGKCFGKWVNGDVIPAKGKTAMEVIIESLREEYYGTIYYGDMDYAPTSVDEVLALKGIDAGNIEFTITPMKTCNVLAFPKGLVELVSVVSVNGEPWYNPLVDADYYDTKIELLMKGELYAVWTMRTDLPMEIPAIVIFKN